MANRDFITWLSGFRDSIADYDYYIDFEALLEKYPEILKCIPLLLAVRANEIYAIDGDGEFTYEFKKPNLSAEQYKVFMHKTGLFDLMANHIVNNLVDYATGVETGLDSNGRKNRGGHLMEGNSKKIDTALEEFIAN